MALFGQYSNISENRDCQFRKSRRVRASVRYLGNARGSPLVRLLTYCRVIESGAPPQETGEVGRRAEGPASAGADTDVLVNSRVGGAVFEALGKSEIARLGG